MKTSIDKRGYIVREKPNKFNKKVTEGNQVLGLRSTEVGASTNLRAGEAITEESIKEEIGKRIIDEFRFSNSIVAQVVNDKSLEPAKQLEFNPCNANTWDDTEKTRFELGKQVNEILTAVNEAQQDISQDANNKANILSNLFRKATPFANQHPAKKIAFEFLHTQEPNNEAIFEAFGGVLEMQNIKAAKELYVKGLSSDKLFRSAVQRIQSVMRRHEDSPATSALKTIFNISLFNRTAISQIQEQLKDPSNSIHENLKKFVEEERKERNIFLKD